MKQSIFSKMKNQSIASISRIRIEYAIKSHNTIICQRHIDPDPDAIGSQHGLARAIKLTYPKKHVYCVGENQPSLNWLGKSDTVRDDIFKHALVIVADCPDVDRISDDRYKTADEIVKIDHHPLVDKFADIAWIDPSVSSASEMISYFLLKAFNFKVDKVVATDLYAGIIGDTGRFMFPGVTGNTFRMVGYLADFGIDMNYINRKETETNIHTAHLYGYLEQHIHMLSNGTAYYVVTEKLMNHFHITPDDFISKNLPSNIKGVVAWAMFTEADNNVLKISLRSHAPAINKLAKKYNGGGHALASGARIENNHNTKANIQKVIHDLSEVVDEYKNN